MSQFILKILRGTPKQQYWEYFIFDTAEVKTVISCLMQIQKNPVTRDGKTVEPVAWESGCLEEVCGSCSVLINGRPRQACTALVDVILQETKSDTITLSPMTKFPLVRDLVVDRSKMFENLKKVQAYVEVDSSTDNGFGPTISQEKQEIMYQLSRCMSCGCCLEGCPNVNEKSSFMGPAVIGQVRLFNIHPVAGLKKAERLREMMQEGGVSGCGNAQNCVRVCPKHIPLTDAIAAISRDTTIQAIKDLFSLPER